MDSSSFVYFSVILCAFFLFSLLQCTPFASNHFIGHIDKGKNKKSPKIYLVLERAEASKHNETMR